MDPEDLLDAIDDLSPQDVLIISIANHLREAVGEGRVSSVVLTQDHLRMLVHQEFAPALQQAAHWDKKCENAEFGRTKG